MDSTSANEDLVRAARGGDPEALSRLWRASRGWLATVLLAHGVRDGELEDLLQEVALVVLEKIDTLRDPRALRPWLRRVAVNAARMSARRRLRAGPRSVELQAVETELEDPLAGQDLDRATARSEVDHVLKHVRELRLEYREPLLMRAVAGMSQREIAESLGVPETTVETRLARARKLLVERLARADRGVRAMAAAAPRRVGALTGEGEA